MGLEGLTKNGQNWNARCPLCGDSKKSRSKKRFWVRLSKNQQYYVCCYNCQEYYPFISFMRLFYPPLYQEYKKENAKYFIQYRKKREKRILKRATHLKKEDIIDNCIDLQIFRNAYNAFLNSNFTVAKTRNVIATINTIPDTHISKQYVLHRKIPSKYFDELCYTKSFMHLCNSISPNTFKRSPRFDERLVIPFFDLNNELIGLQGRSLDPNVKPKYLTWMFDKEHPKLYGCNRIDRNSIIFVVEGPIDSMFLKNSIAIAGADFNSNELLRFAEKDKFVFLYDPEPRNIEIVNIIQKRIDEGFRVCVLPESIRKFGKDINDFILNGLTMPELMKIINNNIFKGTDAKIRLNLWKKIYNKRRIKL